MQQSQEQHQEEQPPEPQDMGELPWLSLPSIAHILTYVPMGRVLTLMTVSRFFKETIENNRRFIDLHIKNTGLALSGFLIQDRMLAFENSTDKTYVHIPSFDNLNRRRKPRVCDTIFDFMPEDVTVESSCNGLVCCRGVALSKSTIYICNPLKRAYVRLNYEMSGRYALAFDPRKGSTLVTTEFKLIRVWEKTHEVQNNNSLICFDIYSSNTGEWITSEANCFYRFWLVGDIQGIYIEGNLFWRCSDNFLHDDPDDILAFEVNREYCWVISPPTLLRGFKLTCMGEWEGILCYVNISHKGVRMCLEVWDHKEGSWKLRIQRHLEEIGAAYHKFNSKLRRLVSKDIAKPNLRRVRLLSFKDGMLVIRLKHTIYLYHIEKNTATKACRYPGDSDRHRAFPYCMSLVPLDGC